MSVFVLLVDSARGLIKCMSINKASFRKGRRKGKLGNVCGSEQERDRRKVGETEEDREVRVGLNRVHTKNKN